MVVAGVRRAVAMLGNNPTAIVVDVSAISARLATLSPVALGITSKRLANIRSDFLAALKASGLISPSAFRKSPLSRSWLELFERHSGRRGELGLARLARAASTQGLPPPGLKRRVVTELVSGASASYPSSTD